jgi:hypothetical protein
MDPVGNTLSHSCYGPGGYASWAAAVSGTYTFFLWPQNATPGTIQATLYNTDDVTGTTTVNGTPATVTIVNPYQKCRYIVPGDTGTIGY